MNELQHRIAKQIRILAVIEAPCHFVKVGREMLGGDAMPSPHDAALEKRERRLNRIRVNVAPRIFFCAMVDSLVLILRDAGFLHGPGVYGVLIRHNHVYIVANVLFDVLCERACLDIGSMEEPKIAAALTDSNYWLFGFLASIDAPSNFLSANIGFVHLDRASQFLKRQIGGHCVTDAVTEIPRRPVVDSQHPMELVRRHPFLGLAKHIDSKEPLSKWKVRVMEDRSRRDGELVAA